MLDEEKMTLDDLKKHLRQFKRRYLTTGVADSARQATGVRSKSRDRLGERGQHISTGRRCHRMRRAGAEGGFRSVGDPYLAEHYGVSRESLSTLIPYLQALSRLPVVETCVNSVLARRGIRG
jgi:hypothetical protein